MIEDSETPHEELTFCGRCFPEVQVTIIKHLALGRGFKPHEMPQEGTLAAAASPHDDKDIPAFDREVEVPHEHKITVGHGEVLHDNMGIILFHESVSSLKPNRDYDIKNSTCIWNSVVQPLEKALFQFSNSPVH